MLSSALEFVIKLGLASYKFDKCFTLREKDMKKGIALLITMLLANFNVLAIDSSNVDGICGVVEIEGLLPTSFDSNNDPYYAEVDVTVNTAVSSTLWNNWEFTVTNYVQIKNWYGGWTTIQQNSATVKGKQLRRGHYLELYFDTPNPSFITDKEIRLRTKVKRLTSVSNIGFPSLPAECFTNSETYEIY